MSPALPKKLVPMANAKMIRAKRDRAMVCRAPAVRSAQKENAKLILVTISPVSPEKAVKMGVVNMILATTFNVPPDKLVRKANVVSRQHPEILAKTTVHRNKAPTNQQTLQEKAPLQANRRKIPPTVETQHGLIRAQHRMVRHKPIQRAIPAEIPAVQTGSPVVPIKLRAKIRNAMPPAAVVSTFPRLFRLYSSSCFWFCWAFVCIRDLGEYGKDGIYGICKTIVTASPTMAGSLVLGPSVGRSPRYVGLDYARQRRGRGYLASSGDLDRTVFSV